MMMKFLKSSSAVVAASLTAGVCLSDAVTADRVRAAVRAVIDELPARSVPKVDWIRERSYAYGSVTAYFHLAEVVSNDFLFVCEHFDDCATNELERMILLSSAWAYGEDYYVSRFSNVVELVDRGLLTTREFRWFRTGSRNPSLTSVLSMRFDWPGISNVVNRMQHVTGETNYCQRILSGAAKSDALQYLDSLRSR